MSWKRTSKDGLDQIEVYECPIEVLAALARKARVDVTVENVSPVLAVDQWFESSLALAPDAEARRHSIRNATFDIALNNTEFLALMPFWDSHGVYAVFTERSPVAFKASRLPVPARCRALQNFGFVLEFGLAGPASDCWSLIVSPLSELVDLAEEILSKS